MGAPGCRRRSQAVSQSTAQPTHGFGSKTAFILAMRQQGKTHSWIGQMLDMDARAVSSLAHKANRRLKRTKRYLLLETNAFLDIEREAVRRGEHPGEFASRLLTAIVTDKLYSAVLDD